MRETNQALLAKLGWRMLQNKDTIWSRLIRGKYCNNRADVDMFETRAGASSIWRGIVHGAKVLTLLLKTGLRVDVGNGQSTFFWIHPDAENWTPHGWNWTKISPYLHHDILLDPASGHPGI